MLKHKLSKILLPTCLGAITTLPLVCLTCCTDEDSKTCVIRYDQDLDSAIVGFDKILTSQYARQISPTPIKNADLKTMIDDQKLLFYDCVLSLARSNTHFSYEAKTQTIKIGESSCSLSTIKYISDKTNNGKINLQFDDKISVLSFYYQNCTYIDK